MSDLKGREFYELWLIATAPGRPPSMDVAPWPSLTVSEQNEWKLLADIAATRRVPRFNAVERAALEISLSLLRRESTKDPKRSFIGALVPATCRKLAVTIRAMLDGEKP